VSPARRRRGTVLLAFGAGLGVLVAAAGLVGAGHVPGRGLPPAAVARVDGTVIRAEDFARSLDALARDRRDGLTAEDRQRVLDRLIDEELLVQRGIALGLARQDPRVRRDLTAAVIDAVVTQHDDVTPSDEELAAFYEREREFFARPGRLRVRQVWCRAASGSDGAAAETRAREAATRLRAGEDIVPVRAALGDAELAPVPDVLLPPAKLLDYLGPTALGTALGLAAGAVSDPVRSGTGFHVLQVVEREATWVPPREDIADDVLAEYRRRAGDRALRAYLDGLRARADIEVAP
jgi:parvulin-like peptidyl-prolyl cis-trans isomerase-like protein/SurA-like protein